MRTALTILGIMGLVVACAQAESYITPDEVPEDSPVWLQGEYLGTVDEEHISAAQVVDWGDGSYELILYEGGLPGEGWDPDFEKVRGIRGERDNGSVTFTHEDASAEVSLEGTLTVRGADGEVLGVLERTIRQGPTLGMEAPEEATVLFDGTDLDMWREGAEMTEDGLLTQGARTAEDYGDMFMHLEYMLPYWEPDDDQPNSGIYIQNRYEVQILGSFGRELANNLDGSLYREKAPEFLATLPPLQWQTYDILFRAPRFDEDGNKTENVRISVFQNGALIHDDVELDGGTGAGGDREPPEVEAAHTLFQDHGTEVRFRNVWVVEDAQEWPEPVTDALDIE
ncbi:MAG: DUF1080 domain-containing protein [Candidatus Hydrogenedentota bacterium]